MSIEPVDGFIHAATIKTALVSNELYVSAGSGKPVIVLHELPGMTASFLEYCRGLQQGGFRVYIPLLFGSPNAEMKFLQQIGLLCVSREFKALFSTDDDSRERPVVQLIDEIVRHVQTEHPTQAIGIIGMCLTGGFALAGIANENVNAAICCQPSYPFTPGDIKTIGLSKDRRDRIKKRLHKLPAPCARGYRYKRDYLSRTSHVTAISETMGEHFVLQTLDGRGHSTVTGNKVNHDVVRDIAGFLDKRL